MADITVTIPNSTFTITQVSSGIEVTTPTDVVIEVSSDSQTIDITNTPSNINVTEVGVTNTDQLIEGTTNLFFTNARARSAISLTTDDATILDYNSSTGVFTWDTPTTTKINEGTNLYYTTARANTDFDTRLATKTTTNLAEGTNLYYTTARANTDFDTRLATKDTDDLAEGSSNQYFTQARARLSLSAGTGISYDNVTGVITNTSINTDTTYTQNFTSTTGGTNLNLVGSDATTDTVKFANGTGVTVTRTDADTATISIGQSVATTDAVTFGSVNIDSLTVIDTATLTTSATTADQVLDSFSSSTYRTAKYVISVSSGSDYQSIEMLVVHNGTTATQTTYADVVTNASLATFSVDISGGNVRLLTTPQNTVTVYKVAKTAIVV
jgi:hypothetical protein